MNILKIFGKVLAAVIVLQVARSFPQFVALIMVLAGFFFAKTLTMVVASGERVKIAAMLVPLTVSASTFLLINFGIWNIQIPAMSILAFATLGVALFLTWQLWKSPKSKIEK